MSVTLTTLTQLAGAVEYTDCISANGLDMTLNTLIVKL